MKKRLIDYVKNDGCGIGWGIVREDLCEDHMYGEYVAIDSMIRFAGCLVTIIEEHSDYFKIAEDPEECCWTEEMFSELHINNRYGVVR